MADDKLPPELLRLVSTIPELQSLLYDLDLLPEQLTEQLAEQIPSRGQFLLIAMHFGALINRLDNNFLNFNETLKNASIDVSEKKLKLLLEEMRSNYKKILACNKAMLDTEVWRNHQHIQKEKKEFESRKVMLENVLADYIYSGADIILSRLGR